MKGANGIKLVKIDMVVEFALSACGRFASVTLKRPEAHNAINKAVQTQLVDALTQSTQQEGLRGLFLRSEGPTFCAGGDLAHMKASAALSRAENEHDAFEIAQTFRQLAELPIPTVAVVQGNAFGGGVGLAAACDVVLATQEAKFALPEARMGVMAATICPFVLRRVGARQARVMILLGHAVEGAEAQQAGLVDRLFADQDALEQGVQEVEGLLGLASPGALAASKRLLATLTGPAAPEGDELSRVTAAALSDQRASEDGLEGMSAFLERRKPRWVLPEGV